MEGLNLRAHLWGDGRQEDNRGIRTLTFTCKRNNCGAICRVPIAPKPGRWSIDDITNYTLPGEEPSTVYPTCKGDE